jgi:quercetin dioxygenase-like cupin family protein
MTAEGFAGLPERLHPSTAPAELSLLEKVTAIEDVMRQHPNQLALPVRHHFCEGVYGREMEIPKGTLVTGKIHLHQQLNILLKGELSVTTESGVVRVRAPFIVVSPPGTKRLAYAHEDSAWLTVLPTTETDPAEIERQFTVETMKDYRAFLERAEIKELE